MCAESRKLPFFDDFLKINKIWTLPCLTKLIVHDAIFKIEWCFYSFEKLIKWGFFWSVAGRMEM